ncbi:hypothetical protein RHGRI_013819 [Rhododendron griersonianum]|uniref:ATP-dependent Clp protease proteolytic subunit n=1 Tax=Rhododendron griersonianum TaxID=479676 RepID=A0AAV6K6Y2_9ERIC|nr:hypothetical protein RHGRI_013819 [Rhododendron griersonianum]
MATSLLSPTSAPPAAAFRFPFLHVSKLSFASSPASSAASRRCRFRPPMASAEDPLNEKPTDDDKKSFEKLYGLSPKQLNMFISRQKYAAKQPENISQLDNFVNHSGMAIASSMSDRGPPNKIMNIAGSNEPWPPITRGWGRVKYKGKLMPEAPDLMSRFFMERVIFVEDISREDTEHIIAQLWWLDNYERKPIYMYLLSEGEDEDDIEYYDEEQPRWAGSDLDGLAIANFMMTRKSDIITINMGMADGVAALLLSLGVKGRRGIRQHAITRLSLPGVDRSIGLATDIWQTAKVVDSSMEIFLELLSRGTGKPMMELYRDLHEPKVFTAKEAIAYGLADKIVAAPDSLADPPKKKSPEGREGKLAAQLGRLAKFQAKKGKKSKKSLQHD